MLPVQVHHRQVLTERASVQIPWTRGIVQLTHSIWSHQLKRFSIITQTAPEGTDTLCTAFMFYQQRLASPLTVVFHFVVVRDLESRSTGLHVPCHLHIIVLTIHVFRKCKKSMRSGQGTTLEICIEEDSSPTIKLDQDEQEVGQWTIFPLSSPTQVFYQYIIVVIVTVIKLSLVH